MDKQQIGSLSITEVNDVGSELATYVYTRVPDEPDETKTAPEGQKTLGRVDIILPKRKNERLDINPWYSPLGLQNHAYDLLQSLVSIFLPAGFPHTVRSDYVPYQIYDSLQAFSSSIAGLLASRAALEGLGVGGSTKKSPGAEPGPSSSATAVVLLSILQESMGRIATILFAWRLGTSLEPEAKRWRLAADFFNDSGMILETLTPMIPTSYSGGWYARICLLSGASVLRALCGVAAGSSKATLSQHFAVEENGGNVGELNAKDSSQETVISLLGMWAGSLVLSRAISRQTTWLTLIMLLFIHLLTNYLAVRSVCMTSLNRQRTNIVFSNFIENGTVPTPAEAAKLERIFEKDGLLRWKGSTVLGHGQIGGSLKDLIRLMGGVRHKTTGSVASPELKLDKLIKASESENYIPWLDGEERSAVIVLKVGATVEDQLKGWCHALLLAREVNERAGTPGVKHWEHEAMIDLIQETLKRQKSGSSEYTRQLQEAGWDVKVPALETKPGCRVAVHS